MPKSTKAFHDFPAPYTLKTEEGMVKFRKNIKELEDKNEKNYMLQIKFLIYIKLLFHLWKVEDYKEFKQIFSNANMDKIITLGPSIIKCLESSEFTIYEELERFSKETDWYPKKIKDPNNNIINGPIKLLDSFFIIDYLEKYMTQFIAKYGEELNSKIELSDKYQDYIDLDNFHNKFDEKFAYLEKYSLFKDVYINIKNDSLSRLMAHIYKLKSREGAKKINSECWGPNFDAIKDGKGQTEYKNKLIRAGTITPAQRVKEMPYSNYVKCRKY